MINLEIGTGVFNFTGRDPEVEARARGRVRITAKLHSRLLLPREEIGDLNVEGSGEFHYRRQRGAALAAENLRQVPFREIGFKIEAVERAVLLDHDLAQPSAE